MRTQIGWKRSAFGFGGINAHLLVEEWLDDEAGAGDREGSRAPEIRQDKNLPPVAIAVVGMDAHFGPWQSLRAFQERVLGGDPSVSPTGPGRWWSADRTNWFREEGLAETPFNGFYLDEVAVSPDRFRIPPREMEEMLPQQLLMLKTAAGAMADAGLDRDAVLRALRERIVVLDGAKALRKAAMDVFGERALIQRCQEHKKRNVAEQLPESMRTPSISCPRSRSPARRASAGQPAGFEAPQQELD